MSELERLALGTLLPSFEGATLPEWIHRALANGLAGVTLFGPNIVDADQLRRLTAELRTSADPLISLDEEGGDVTRIDYNIGSRFPGNAALGIVDDVELTRTVAHAIGTDLRGLGVNLNLAPCGDVNTVSENPVIGTRAFGSDPKLVGRHTAAAVAGIQAAGVAACVKHFPGHGATRQDSHHEVPVVDASRDQLETRELVPFRAAIEAGTKALMTAHVRVPTLTGDDPATLSAAALRTMLRSELGFDGVIVTDALDMKAIVDGVGLARGAVRSLAAGSNLLCLGPIPGESDVAEIVQAIVTAVENGTLPLACLEESAARVAELHRWLRVAEPEPRPPGDVGLAAARRAVQVTGDLPRSGAWGEPYVVEVSTPPTIAVGEVPWGLAAFFPDAVRVDPNRPEAATVVDAIDALDPKGPNPRPLVVVVRDAHRHPDCRRFVERLLAHRPDATLVEMGLPIWTPECGAYVATYGAARVNARAAAELLTSPTPQEKSRSRA